MLNIFFITCNAVHAVIAIAVLSLGIASGSLFDEFDYFLEAKYYSIASLLIALSVFVFLLIAANLIGFIVSGQYWYYVVKGVAVLTLICCILNIAATISSYTLNSMNSGEIIKEALNSSMDDYGNLSKSDSMKSWNNLQVSYDCCGVNDPSDWTNNDSFILNLPLTCCDIASDNSAGCFTHSESLRKDGCLTKFVDSIEAHSVAMGSISLVLLLSQFAVITANVVERMVNED